MYKLGFVDEIPCSLELDVNLDQIEDLRDEILDMEVGVYLFEDILLANPATLSEEDKKIQKEIKAREKEYLRYEPLEGVLFEILESAVDD